MLVFCFAFCAVYSLLGQAVSIETVALLISSVLPSFDSICKPTCSNLVIHVDVAVVHALRSSNARLAPAMRDGYTCAVEESNKRRRYPGGRLTPAVFECHGRCGDAMAAMLRSVHRSLPPDERAIALGRAWQALSCTLQRGNAEIILAAGAPG